MTTTVRKTAKYYRDVFSGNDIRKAVGRLPEFLMKFGYEDKTYGKGRHDVHIRQYTKSNWNHRIEKFSFDEKTRRATVSIYWQGDSTDGNTSVYANELIYGKVIPAEWDNIGGEWGMVCRHSPLRIDSEEFAAAVHALAEYLSPTEIRARKERDRRAAVRTEVFRFIEDVLSKGRKDNEFCNGCRGVQKVLEKEPSLLDKPIDELKEIVRKVFINNHHSDYYLRGNRYDGPLKYNLDF